MRKKKSSILEAVYDTATGLHKAGAIDLATLREFDQLCLPQKFEQRPASSNSHH
jgi:putative transcriptional regulator